MQGEIVNEVGRTCDGFINMKIHTYSLTFHVNKAQ